jgi:hypothetical protein
VRSGRSFSSGHAVRDSDSGRRPESGRFSQVAEIDREELKVIVEGSSDNINLHWASEPLSLVLFRVPSVCLTEGVVSVQMVATTTLFVQGSLLAAAARQTEPRLAVKVRGQ